MARNLLLFFSLLPIIAVASPGPWVPGQPCPDDIRTTVPAAGAFSSMESIHRALLTCPGIKSLQLRITVFGCTGFPDHFNFPLSIDSQDRYLPALEILSLKGYRFEEKEWDELEGRVGGPHLPHIEVAEHDDFWQDWSFYVMRSIDKWLIMWSWRLSDLARWRKHVHRTEAEKNTTNLDLLLERMDFSQVRELAVKDSCWQAPENAGLLRWADALPSIQSLAVSGSWDCRFDWHRNAECAEAPSFVPDFIAALPSTGLTNLTWVNGGTCDPETLGSVLDQHGSSLTALEWRHDEFKWKNRSVFTAEALRNFGERAPNLQSLTIDMNQKDEWPIDELQAVAKGMPNLTELTIYFRHVSDFGWAANNASIYRYGYRDSISYEEEYGGKEEMFLATPQLTKHEATKLYDTLQAAKAGTPFRMVEFRTGDWTRPWEGPLRTGYRIFEGARQKYTCAKLRGDGTPKGEDEEVCGDNAYDLAEFDEDFDDDYYIHEEL